MLRFSILGLFLFPAGCTTVDFEAAKAGQFSGSALVVWVGPGDDQTSGDGDFLYVPLKGDELTLTRNSGANASAGNEVIKPDAFYTDGGSIPRFAQSIRGLNAWAFGPAYIVHDWLFVVKKCANKKIPDALKSPIAKMKFQESADIMAEAIKSAAVTYNINPETVKMGNIISNATASGYTKTLWESDDCRKPAIEAEHEEILEKINGQSAAILSGNFQTSTLFSVNRLKDGREWNVIGLLRVD